MAETPGQADAGDLWALTNCGGCARKAPAMVTRDFAAMAGCANDATFMSDVGLADLQGNTLGLTVDFITPVVPDPVHFGQIAAANALSDIYAAGMLPRFALAIACVPEGGATSSFARALAAGSAYLAAHGCILVGGHSVTDTEPKLGFAVVGQPNRTGRILGQGAQPGDALILTKPLGVGILTSACKAGLIPIGALDVAVQAMLSSSSFLPGLIESPGGEAIHAATDVTGYGLLGHLWELCTRSAVGAEVMLDSLPVLPGVRDLATADVHTSAFRSNSQYVTGQCDPPLTSLPLADQLIVTDPQTSGGLLLFAAAGAIADVLASLPGAPYPASVIGTATAKPGMLRLTPRDSRSDGAEYHRSVTGQPPA
jgi:selenide, water dikinase